MGKIQIKEKYAKIMERMIVAFFMTQIVSFTIIVINYGFISEFLLVWARSHIIALAVGMPTCLLLSPIVEKLMKNIPKKTYEQKGD